MGCDLVGGTVLSAEEADALWKSKPAPMRRTEEEILKHLERAIDPSVYEAAFDKRLIERLEAIKVERTALKKKFEGEDLAWLEGIDDVALASRDLLSVNVYYPACPGGAGR